MNRPPGLPDLDTRTEAGKQIARFLIDGQHIMPPISELMQKQAEFGISNQLRLRRPCASNKSTSPIQPPKDDHGYSQPL